MEMVIVVAIMMILITVAVPRYRAHKRASQTTEASQTAGMIIDALHAYMAAMNVPPQTAQQWFNNEVLSLDRSGPISLQGNNAQNSLTWFIPQLALPPNANFDYQVSANVANTGPEAGYAVFCVLALGRSTAGVANGVVLLSSSAASATAAGWQGPANILGYVDYGSNPHIQNGGYCGNNGTVQQNYN